MATAMFLCCTISEMVQLFVPTTLHLSEEMWVSIAFADILDLKKSKKYSINFRTIHHWILQSVLVTAISCIICLSPKVVSHD